jgi:2'-5' RNA ligase
MTDYRDHHATIFLPPEVADSIEAARREWDPVMARRIAAHVTLVYPQEAPNAELLVDRIREASDRVEPFRLRLGDLACSERPEYGVCIKVEDIDGGYRRMREHVLRPPFHWLAFPAHVTLMHPRTSRRGREFFGGSGYERQIQEFAVQEIAVTAFDGVVWASRGTYALTGRQGR